MKRLFSMLLACVLTVSMLTLTGCTENAEIQDKQTTRKVTQNLIAAQPTPSDIDFSLERYNLIRRAYWVNGQHEKADALVCEVEKPLGYIILIDYGVVVGSYCVDGKVSSLNSYLTPDSEYYSSPNTSNWLADVDGSYGENDGGIFFFTPDGHYHEWNGEYHYSDVPFHLNAEPLVKED